jgi:hypothetical protein
MAAPRQIPKGLEWTKSQRLVDTPFGQWTSNVHLPNYVSDTRAVTVKQKDFCTLNRRCRFSPAVSYAHKFFSIVS